MWFTTKYLKFASDTYHMWFITKGFKLASGTCRMWLITECLKLASDTCHMCFILKASNSGVILALLHDPLLKVLNSWVVFSVCDSLLEVSNSDRSGTCHMWFITKGFKLGNGTCVMWLITKGWKLSRVILAIHVRLITKGFKPANDGCYV